MPIGPSAVIVNLVKQASNKYNVPASLILAHMKRESDFIPTASRKEPQINDESIGLMQVLIKTARWVMNDQSITRKDLFDPKFNIDVGTKYIKINLDKYKGNIRKAIAAYNAGSARFKSDRTTFINQDYVDFVYRWYKEFSSSSFSNLVLPLFLMVGLGGMLFIFRKQL